MYLRNTAKKAEQFTLVDQILTEYICVCEKRKKAEPAACVFVFLNIINNLGVIKAIIIR